MSTENDFKPYLVSYHHDGAEWSLTVHAKDEDDLRARLKVLPLARIHGVLVMRIPCYPGAGLFVRALTWVRNLFYGKGLGA